MKKYRIVWDEYAGFEVQVRRWWVPFWVQATTPGEGCNTHLSVEAAEAFARKHSRIGKQVKYLGRLP